MKNGTLKNALICFFVISLAFAVTGCGKKDTAADKVDNKFYSEEFKNAPKWVMMPEIEGGIAAVGSAKIGKAGMQFARNEALANGRSELANMAAIKVKNLIKNFSQTTGIGDTETVDKVSSQITKQVASQLIAGSRQKDMWISPSNELYSLVAIDPATAQSMVRDSAVSSFRDDNALWQKFQEQKANEELDREVEKEFGEYRQSN